MFHVDVVEIAINEAKELTQVPDNIPEVAKRIVKDSIERWKLELEPIDMEMFERCSNPKPYIPGVEDYIELMFERRSQSNDQA